MSRYAHLVCMDCKISYFIGKAIYREDEHLNYFHIGPASEPPNWQRTELNRVIWKMLADHAGHRLKVLLSGDPELEQFEFINIDGTAINDISVEDYLKDWGEG